MTDHSARARVSVGLARIDPMTAEAAVDEVMVAASGDGTFVVVTPNIQHVVLLERDPRFLTAYDAADLVLPDGWPVARAAARRHGSPVTRVTGADLLEPVLARCAAEGRSVAFVGGRPGAARAAAERAVAEHPDLVVALVDESDFSPDADPQDVQRLREVLGDGADVLVMGLGTPKQEVLVTTAAQDGPLPVRVVLCIGASIDFYAGVVDRAPESLRRWNLEWAYRVAKEPRRLARRYASAAPAFLAIVVRDGRGARRTGADGGDA